ncbi:nucleotide-binding universal stress UspA family protein [Bradyrhizobium elkanii]|nr:nucleotide-binding universal stress UspA family protein [Bradyrhizobium elkanii]MCS4111932.1 nucleotide-binding universal stress UspA family protein [Bradyrhizobium elkanii]
MVRLDPCSDGKCASTPWRMVMFKNILVHIPTELSPRPAVDGSVSLALGTGAHLDAMAIGYETASVPFVVEGGAAVASLFEAEHEQALERAEVALRVFDIEARNAGISYATRAVGALPIDAREMICASARLHDLTVVVQPLGEYNSYDNVIPRELLFQAGGPVLFIPYTFHGAFSAKRIGICWDGSRLAARALHDAMPLLRAADALAVITIDGVDPIPAECSTDHLVRYLAKEGLPAKITSLPASKSEVQSILLSIAADESLDLLVMGGYGHSRLQETLLGGVTRDMLRAMTVPVLMSH